MAKSKCYVCNKGPLYGKLVKYNPVIRDTHPAIWLHTRCRSKSPPQFQFSSGHTKWQSDQKAAPKRKSDRLLKRKPKTNLQIKNFVNEVQTLDIEINQSRFMLPSDKIKLKRASKKMLALPQVKEWSRVKRKLEAKFNNSPEYVTAVMSNQITQNEATKLYKSIIHNYLKDAKLKDRIEDNNERDFDSEDEPFLESVRKIEQYVLYNGLDFSKSISLYNCRRWKEGLDSFFTYYLEEGNQSRKDGKNFKNADPAIIELFIEYKQHKNLFQAVLSSKIKLERARNLLIDWNFSEYPEAVQLVLEGEKPRDVAKKFKIKPDEGMNPFSNID